LVVQDHIDNVGEGTAYTIVGRPFPLDDVVRGMTNIVIHGFLFLWTTLDLLEAAIMTSSKRHRYYDGIYLWLRFSIHLQPGELETQ